MQEAGVWPGRRKETEKTWESRVSAESRDIRSWPWWPPLLRPELTVPLSNAEGAGDLDKDTMTP